jgi:hypothetical protein
MHGTDRPTCEIISPPASVEAVLAHATAPPKVKTQIKFDKDGSALVAAPMTVSCERCHSEIGSWNGTLKPLDDAHK